MKIERFEVPGLAQYSYVISDGGEAVVIDPIRDFDRYTAYAEREGLRIVHVTETHIHADFASGAAALAEMTGAELELSAYDEGETYRYAMAHRKLHDGDAIAVGGLRLKALHTPGHTPEHLSFVLYDTSRSATEPMAIFTGDFLFVGSLGRPDLLGEQAKVALAHALYRSLTERIAALPDGVQVYPGHGAGSLCGAGMAERAESTLGFERTTDPFFGYDEEQFVREILASVPPMPVYYPRMKSLNAEGATNFLSLPRMMLTALEVEERVAAGETTVLDLRRPEAFGGAHVPGAINIGAGQNLSLWAGWLLDAEREIVLVGDGGDMEESRRALLRVGLDRIAGSLRGGMPAWIEAGLEFARTTQLSVPEVETRGPEEVVLDVRSDAEWKAGHIEGAMHVMLGDLSRELGRLERKTPVTTVCGSGYRSSIAASLLQANGFTDVKSMDGGMAAWAAHAGRTMPVSA